jgi:cobalt ECF transporter T component CbiQ
LQNSFVERTLTQINDTLEQSLFAEKLARQKGLLQLFDPRAKLIGILILLTAVATSRQTPLLALFLALSLLAAGFSRIPLRAFIQRVLLLVLLFTGIIALPALFMTPGPTLWQFPLGLVVTVPGARSVLFLLLRVSTSVSWASLLILTTPWNNLLKAFGKLHLPDEVVLILGMTYRYIHMLLHESVEMFLSRKSRLLKKLPPSRERELLGATGGVLMERSLQVSSEVYLAMQSRGYRHYPRTLAQFQLRWFDWAFLHTTLVAFVAAFILH